MFKPDILFPYYKNLLGWVQYFDADEFQIDPDLVASETGEFYQDKHPALQLNIIKATLPDKKELDVYLLEKVKAGVNCIFNDLLQYRMNNAHGKTLLETAQLLNRPTWSRDTIVNQNRFVGFQIHVKDQTGIQAVLNEIGLQLDGEQEIVLYLFHSQKEDPIHEYVFNTVNTTTVWRKVDEELNSHKIEEFHGGLFVLGYYQEDLITSAINYANFNWERGECNGCNGNYYAGWQNVKRNFTIFPLYVPNGSFTKGKMFDTDMAFYEPTLSWGLNLRLTVRCDFTEFFIQNKFAFKNLLALKVTHLILNDIKFSQEINFIEENLKMMVIRDLEGDKETNALNIAQQYKNELKAVTFNISGLNNRCLDCREQHESPQIGFV